jgi:hypothetical protein
MFSSPELSADVFGDVRNIVTDAEWHESARVIRVLRDKTDLAGERSGAW